MVTRLFNNLATYLQMPRREKENKYLLEYAKTEYRSDWQYAYRYMLEHDGKGPKDSRWR